MADVSVVEMNPMRRLTKSTTTPAERLSAVVEICYSAIISQMKEDGIIAENDPNFDETPARVGRSFVEIFGGALAGEQELSKILSKAFPTNSSQMVSTGPVKVWSVCPHHFLPVEMEVWLGYIPNGQALGLSKLARIAAIIAAAPAMQEDTTEKIVATLAGFFPNPLGAGVLIRGRHLCMTMRGAKQDAWTTTTALRGNFLNNPATKAEFLSVIGASSGR